MKDKIRIAARIGAGPIFPDVALDEAETPPPLRADVSRNCLEIVGTPRREVIETDDVLPELQQSPNQMRPDEPGRSRYQPRAPRRSNSLHPAHGYNRQ